MLLRSCSLLLLLTGTAAIAGAQAPPLDWVPPGGLAIPDAGKPIYGTHDKDGDGRLSTAEIAAMPEPLRTRLEAIQRSKTSSVALKIPSEGIALPESATMLREKYDRDKDGRLSQEEFDAIDQPGIKAQVELLARKQLGSAAIDTAPAGPITEAKSNAWWMWGIAVVGLAGLLLTAELVRRRLAVSLPTGS